MMERIQILAAPSLTLNDTSLEHQAVEKYKKGASCYISNLQIRLSYSIVIKFILKNEYLHIRQRSNNCSTNVM